MVNNNNLFENIIQIWVDSKYLSNKNNVRDIQIPGRGLKGHLDLSKYPNLRNIAFFDNNQINSIDVSNCSQLSSIIFNCDYSPFNTKLKLGKKNRLLSSGSISILRGRLEVNLDEIAEGFHVKRISGDPFLERKNWENKNSYLQAKEKAITEIKDLLDEEDGWRSGETMFENTQLFPLSPNLNLCTIDFAYESYMSWILRTKVEIENFKEKIINAINKEWKPKKKLVKEQEEKLAREQREAQTSEEKERLASETKKQAWEKERIIKENQEKDQREEERRRREEEVAKLEKEQTEEAEGMRSESQEQKEANSEEENENQNSNPDNVSAENNDVSSPTENNNINNQPTNDSNSLPLETPESIKEKIKRYFRKNNVKKITLQEDDKLLIEYVDKQEKRTIKVDNQELKIIRGYLQKQTDKSISRKQLSIPATGQPTTKRPDETNHFLAIASTGVIIIVVIGAIFWLIIKLKKQKNK